MHTPTVLVDARNVMRSRWPNLREDEFLRATREWAEREGVQAVVVFDGRAPGGVIGSAPVDERVMLVGTGHGSADDWIAGEAPRLVEEGRRLWLVSSDRGLRDRVTPWVDHMIGGGAFANRLVDLEREHRREARS